MARQIILNLIIAFLWMLLNQSWTGAGFVTGYVLGLLIIGIFRRFFPTPFYLVRIWAVIKLLKMLLVQLFRSSFQVIGAILKPKLDITPGTFKYRTELTSDFEIMLLFLFISLTPGTLALEISKNKRTLYIHAFNMSDEEEMVSSIRDSFEKAIMEVTR
ncbi:Na+/H+ antiporter subunit E [Paenibacillus sp. GYB006]|uniref:Na+/H+ antiporter subunit E n=1 Tax=Paenibacillus sp. GYB006 TaxID=2994394 RepID=UPI002F96504A